MKNKKALKITSITVAILIVIVCITKILAAAIVFDDEEEEWESTGWGMYVVTEDGEEIYSEEGYKSKDGTYTSVETITDKAASDGFYYDELDSDGSIFCMEQGQQLPSRHDENEIRVMGGGSSKGDQYHNGSIIPGLNPKSTSRLNAREIIALERQYGDTTKAIRGGYPYNYFAGGTYYSRSLRDETGHINPGTVTTFATKNDGNIKWSDGTDDVIERYETISWEDAYVLANSDPTANTESNPAQLAIWKLGKLNKGKTSVESSAGDKLYEEALLFGTYRQARDDQGGPKIDADKEYKYKFVMDESGTYLIAGPVTINYGDLELSSGNTELEVRKIEKFTVMGTLADGSEQDITEYVKFTDIDGNELETMNETVGDSDGEGAGQKFPLSEQEFYIKVDYTSPIYTQIRAINSLEVSFKELDVRAEGYKYSDIPVYYTEWIPNNIISQDCYEVHSKVGLQKITTHLKGACTSRPMYGFCGWHSDEYSECYYNGIMHMTNTNSSEGLLLKGTTAPDGNAQMLFFLHKAELYWRKYKLIVLFGPENTPDVPITPETPETPSHPTYIDIGGDVWVDAEETKEGTGTDGKYTEGSADYPRPNVLVKLFFENGTPVRVGINGVVVDRRNTKLVNGSNGNYELYTDENGHYEFYGLPMDQKYYVEFTYDGMMYTTTEFLAGGSVEGYKSSPNDEVYKINSKAEEQQDKRDEFNKRFEEILGKGLDYYSGNKTTGETNKGDKLVYRTETFDGKFKSRLLTTTEEDDVIKLWSENPTSREIGKARPAGDERKYDKENYEMTVSTRNDEKQNKLIYPLDNNFTVWSVDNKNELEYLKHINLGLKRRPTADLNLAVDIKAGGTSIKDKTKLVTFKSKIKEDDLKIKPGDKDFNESIDGTVKELTSGEVVQQIAGTDYYWHKNFEDIYKVTEDQDTAIGFSIIKDELNVYVLYKIMIANQSETQGINATVTGLVDYFSKELTIPTSVDQEKIEKIFEPYGIVKGSYSWTEENPTKITWSNPTEYNGYNKIEADNLKFEIGEGGNVKSIYLVLKVAKDSTDKCLVKDTNMKNITEIKSYKIHDEKGDALGLVDCDSAPYNATPGDKNTYEDDTDDAPMFKLELNWHPKEITGNVWDVLDNTQIKDVKVDLVEYIYNNGDIKQKIRPGLEIVEGKTVGVKKSSSNDSSDVRTGQGDWEDGYYKFVVEGGNYAIRFTYGDTTMLLNNKKYNGQDYQASRDYQALSTIYTDRFNKAVSTTSELKEWLSQNNDPLQVDLEEGQFKNQQEYENNIFRNTTQSTSSNARDLVEFRQEIIESSINLTNQNATLLHRLGEDKPLTDEERETLSGNDGTKTPNYTYMEAISDIVIVESNDLANELPKVVNLALQERPKMSMDLDKQVKKIVVKTNDGTELINTDDTSKLTNLQQLNKIQSVFINMDAKSMEGATIDIDYTITATNNGDLDKLENYQYTTDRTNKSSTEGWIVDRGEDFSDLISTLNSLFGENLNISSELPVKANVIYDYVNINLEYREADNKNENDQTIWTKIYDNNASNPGQIDNNLVTTDVISRLAKTERKVSKVLQTADGAENTYKNLYTTAGDDKKAATIPVHLGITLSEDIDGDNQEAFVYSNCAEIIEVYSGAGRRDYNTIPGNYVPYENSDDEHDASLTGEAVITPPLGESRIYYVITIISATIVIAGIVLIKKKVLKK